EAVAHLHAALGDLAVIEFPKQGLAAGRSDVQSKDASTARSQSAHQNGAPLGAVEHISHHWRAIDVEVVVVVVACQFVQCREYRFGYEGELFYTRLSVETMQHASVAADIHAGRTALDVLGKSGV